MEMKDRIKELRLNKGLTQRELGVLLGVQDSVVAKYENGKVRNIKRATIEKMARIFGVKPTYILAMDEDREWNEEKQHDATVGAELKAMAEMFSHLNREGKAKAMEYLSDLMQVKKYVK